MAGTCTITRSTIGPLRKILATCVGDASTGTVPATALPAFEGKILAVETNPGSPAPTDNYDVTLIDSDGVDRLKGVANNRDTTTSERVDYGDLASGVQWATPVVDSAETLTLTFGGQSVASAQFTVAIWYGPIA